MEQRPEAAVRAAMAADDDAIARIYNHYILTSAATFEIEPVSAAEIAMRRSAAPRGAPWFVGELAGEGVLGYASVAAWKPRAAYGDTVECSLYVDPECQRRGIGRALYDALLPSIWSHGFHAVLAGICLPNPPSVDLHERCGFRPVGRLRSVGYKFGRRIDVGYWQLLRDSEEDETRS